MIGISPTVAIWLYNQPVDMRKQFDGLAALTQTKLNSRANNGELFVFINRKRTQIKLLYYHQGVTVFGQNGSKQGHSTPFLVITKSP